MIQTNRSLPLLFRRCSSLAQECWIFLSVKEYTPSFCRPSVEWEWSAWANRGLQVYCTRPSVSGTSRELWYGFCILRICEFYLLEWHPLERWLSVVRCKKRFMYEWLSRNTIEQNPMKHCLAGLQSIYRLFLLKHQGLSIETLWLLI